MIHEVNVDNSHALAKSWVEFAVSTFDFVVLFFVYNFGAVAEKSVTGGNDLRVFVAVF